jgi:hypothetical protein
MPLFFPILAGALIGCLAIDTEHAYRVLYERKSCQIATDNALIHLGQLDQRLWQRIIEEQNRLEQLHAAHHAVHACARVPGTSAKCLPLDRKAESVLERMHWQLKLRADRDWVRNAHLAYGQFARLGISSGEWKRVIAVPLRERRCRSCGAKFGWEILWRHTETRATSCPQFQNVEGITRWELGEHGKLSLRLLR